MSKETKKTSGHKSTLRNPKFYNKWRRIFQFLVTHVFYMIRFKLVYRLEVQGKENIPESSDYIVAPNHLSTLDPPLVSAVLNRGVAYMAKKELFDNIFLRWWLNWLGAFAVDRENLGVSTIKTVISLKKTGWVLGIFPQGTREKDGHIENVNKGFASFAKTLKCDILPVAITGMTKDERKPFRGKMKIIIGKPIPYNDNPEEMMKHWRQTIADLSKGRV